MEITPPTRVIPSGERLHSYGNSPCLMGKLTISMAIFNSYVKLPEGTVDGKTAAVGMPIGHFEALGLWDYNGMLTIYQLVQDSFHQH